MESTRVIRMSDNSRFGFGKNWKNYLNTVNDERIDEAKKSLSEWIGLEDLSGMSFLDIGSGSGLFSLAAREMGASVHSFDYDWDSVECTQKLKKRFYSDDTTWEVEKGDILDSNYLAGLESADIVYSWGVLHHTGNMYQALENAGKLVKDNGHLFIAIYNDQGGMSKLWLAEKKAYNSLPRFLRFFILVPYMIALWLPRFITDLVKLKPFEQWKVYKRLRGMSPIYDAIDWCGGYPFEVAKPEEILAFFKTRGFDLEKMSTCGGHKGCNQYLFWKN